MTTTANLRTALIAAAGLMMCAASPLRANDANTPSNEAVTAVSSAADTSDEAAQPRHRAKAASAKTRRSDRHAAKAAKKPAESDAAKPESSAAENRAMPAPVADARAQWPAANAEPANTYNMSAQAGQMLGQMPQQPETPAVAAPDDSAANPQVVASDQLNALDRAATETPPLTLAKATIDAPAATTAENTADSPWDKTSLIGKIFIAFGGLLTVASAARMFIA